MGILPLDRWNEPVPTASRLAIASPGAAIGASKPQSTDQAIRARLRLQQRAPANLRQHLRRGLARFAVLIVADLVSFGVVRALVRVVRDHAVLGAAVADYFASVVPRGMLSGWQYGAALFVGLLVTGNYGHSDQRRNPRRLLLACALATVLPLWMTIWTGGMAPVLEQYVVTTLLMWAGLVAERLTVDRAASWVRPPESDCLATLFVGPGPDCVRALGSPAFSPLAGYRPLGFVDSNLPPAPRAIGHTADFSLLLAATGAQVVVLSGHLTDAQFEDIVDTALTAGCQILSIPRSVMIAGVQPVTVWRNGQALVELTAPGLKGWQLALKRVVDVMGAAVGVLVLSPLLAVVAALVKLESRGPVFFTQERVGRGGSVFQIIKFRTMVDGAEKRRDELLSRSVYSDARLFKVPDDPRITRLGRWLRRTSIDELPQLFNVLRGDMSLVGPRPPLFSEVVLYEEHHFARFDVKPGITGPWQVSGRNGVTSFDDVIGLEAAYIQSWSMWADLRLLVKTIPVVVRMHGAF